MPEPITELPILESSLWEGIVVATAQGPNARPELAHGQYWNQILILDSNEFWRIRDRLKRERGWE